MLYVRRACDQGPSEVACNDSYTDGDDKVTMPVTAGTTYYIVLDGYGSSAFGPFNTDFRAA